MQTAERISVELNLVWDIEPYLCEGVGTARIAKNQLRGQVSQDWAPLEWNDTNPQESTYIDRVWCGSFNVDFCTTIKDLIYLGIC